MNCWIGIYCSSKWFWTVMYITRLLNSVHCLCVLTSSRSFLFLAANSSEKLFPATGYLFWFPGSSLFCYIFFHFIFSTSRFGIHFIWMRYTISHSGHRVMVIGLQLAGLCCRFRISLYTILQLIYETTGLILTPFRSRCLRLPGHVGGSVLLDQVGAILRSERGESVKSTVERRETRPCDSRWPY